MTQLAPIAPPNVLRALREYGDHVLGKYHLILAHDVVGQPEQYQGLFPEGSFIIMDNSVIELGSPVPPETIQEAARLVPETRVIILPDAIRDKDQTLDLSFDYLGIHLGDPNNVEIGQWTDQQFMAVPQGRNLEELKQCAREFTHFPNVGCWGVGRHIVELLGSREEFVCWLWHDKDVALTSKRYGPFIHLLGFSDDMEDDLKCARLPGVMGIDSAVPIRLGQKRQLVSRSQQTHEPRGEWWAGANKTDRPYIQPETLANLSLLRGWLQDTKLLVQPRKYDNVRTENR